MTHKNENAKELKNYTIQDIENMSEELAFIYASEKTNIKGHDIYFVDFGGCFGYSALVFLNGKHIKYANDYQLHHRNKTIEELKKFYNESLNHKLFEKCEFNIISGYDDYIAKKYYISNYYSLSKNGISMFFIGTDEEMKARQKEVKKMYFSSISFCYYKEKEAVEELYEMMKALEKAKEEKEKDFEYLKNAFLKEMYNHEYCINWQADFDVISAFASVTGVKDFENLSELFDAADFTELQKKAYLAARKEYYDNQNY